MELAAWLIVRAFGREHLLSVQGGTTTPIATSDELEDTFQDKLALASRIEPASELVKDVAITQRAAEPVRDTKPELTAGGDMIRAALAQRLSAATKSARAADSASAKTKEDKALSQAVAGLVRLRREAQLSSYIEDTFAKYDEVAAAERDGASHRPRHAQAFKNCLRPAFCESVTPASRYVSSRIASFRRSMPNRRGVKARHHAG